jgi:hypothetical protein
MLPHQFNKQYVHEDINSEGNWGKVYDSVETILFSLFCRATVAQKSILIKKSLFLPLCMSTLSCYT